MRILSPSSFVTIYLSRSSPYLPFPAEHGIPRGTAIISFPARTADWLVQRQTTTRSAGNLRAFRFTHALAPAMREKDKADMEEESNGGSGGGTRCALFASTRAACTRAEEKGNERHKGGGRSDER